PGLAGAAGAGGAGSPVLPPPHAALELRPDAPAGVGSARQTTGIRMSGTRDHRGGEPLLVADQTQKADRTPVRPAAVDDAYAALAWTAERAAVPWGGGWQAHRRGARRTTARQDSAAASHGGRPWHGRRAVSEQLPQRQHPARPGPPSSPRWLHGRRRPGPCSGSRARPGARPRPPGG